MKKLILVLLSSLFLFVACDIGGDDKKTNTTPWIEDTSTKPYTGSWNDGSGINITYYDNSFICSVGVYYAGTVIELGLSSFQQTITSISIDGVNWQPATSADLNGIPATSNMNWAVSPDGNTLTLTNIDNPSQEITYTKGTSPDTPSTPDTSTDTTIEPYAGNWVDTSDLTSTFVLSDNYFESNNQFSGLSKGTIEKKQGTADVVILNTTTFQGVSVSTLSDAEKVDLIAFGFILVDQEVTWSISGDVLTLTVNGNVSTYNRQ